MEPKVSGRKIPFPRLLFAICPPHQILNGVVGTNLDNSVGLDDRSARRRRQTSNGRSFVTLGRASAARACATDPTKPSAGRRDASAQSRAAGVPRPGVGLRIVFALDDLALAI